LFYGAIGSIAIVKHFTEVFRSEGAKLVAGARAYICDECVAIARDIMRDEPVEEPTTLPVGAE
jgi:ATP-dependent protease Clp ATPase subunit